MSVATTGSSAAGTSGVAGRSSMHPIYIGATERPLFGWLHRPRAGWTGTRVVLCPPLGYEGLFAHPALRRLGQQLADEGGAAVLRFDYDGTGDSAGSDEDPGRVDAWLASVEAAVDAIQQLAPSTGPVILVGVRAGALLAAIVASRRHDVEGLVLWAPVTSGRAFAREQRAFAMLAHATASAPQEEPLSWGEGGFEANGYVFSSETVAALGELHIDKLVQPPVPHVLVLDREESPTKSTILERWGSDTTSLEVVRIDDYAAMIAPPLTMRIPERSIAYIVDWTRQLHRPEAAGSAVAAPGARSRGHMAPGITEEGMWVGATREQFGILTLPSERAMDRGMIFLNNAGGYRVGPHGMVPMLARALAEHGVASFRLDAAGVGDSALPDDRPPHHPYNLDAVADVAAAVTMLRERGVTQLAAGGLCSAAFLAWHAAQSLPDIRRLVLVNPQTFEWKEGDSLDVSPLQDQYEMNHYRQSARSMEKWLKLFRGEVGLRFVGQLLWKRVRFALNRRFQSIRAAIGIGGTGSAAGNIVRAIGSRGGVVTFIFSGDDPGATYLEQELGGAMRVLKRRGFLQVQSIAGPDHSFTPRWATRRLTDAVLAALADTSQVSRTSDGARARGERRE